MGHQIQGPTANKWVSAEAIILGLAVGTLMMAAAFTGLTYDINHDPIMSTLLVALYLLMLVALLPFIMPTPFVKRSRFWGQWAIAMMCGVVSLFFDSFAVVLLLSTLTISGVTIVAAAQALRGDRSSWYRHLFMIICAFNALTVGGGFYLGELWGLPYFISSGLDNPWAGFPTLIVTLPFSAVLSWLCAKFAPVEVEPVKFDKTQAWAATQFVAGLLAIIITHDAVLCIGGLLVFATLTGRIQLLLFETVKETYEGGGNALGLIGVVLLFSVVFADQFAWLQENVTGNWVILGAIVSSPAMGALLPGAHDLHEFYSNLYRLMIGAPVLVSSSLVAIVVFKNVIDYVALPMVMRLLCRPLKPIDPQGVTVPEAISYTVVTGTCSLALYIVVFWLGGLEITVWAGEHLANAHYPDWAETLKSKHH